LCASRTRPRVAIRVTRLSVPSSILLDCGPGQKFDGFLSEGSQ
jgi:hypothetical protein